MQREVRVDLKWLREPLGKTRHATLQTFLAGSCNMPLRRKVCREQHSNPRPLMPASLAWAAVLKQLPRVHAIPARPKAAGIALVLESPTALKQLGQSVSAKHLVIPDVLVVSC